MWPIVIILLVVAMMVGPIMLMQPTKEQRDLEALRVYAQAQGLKVSASNIQTENGDLCWFYSYSLAEQDLLPVMRLERKAYAHGLHVAGFWAFTSPKVEVKKEIENFLQSLPTSVTAFEINTHAVGVHWSESGGQKSLEAWFPALAKLASV